MGQRGLSWLGFIILLLLAWVSSQQPRGGRLIIEIDPDAASIPNTTTTAKASNTTSDTVISQAPAGKGWAGRLCDKAMEGLDSAMDVGVAVAKKGVLEIERHYHIRYPYSLLVFVGVTLLIVYITSTLMARIAPSSVTKS